MPSVTLTKIDKEADGSIHVRFGKAGYKFNSISHMREYVHSVLSREDLHAIAMALAITRQPALGNPNALEGRVLTVDLSSANWGTIS